MSEGILFDGGFATISLNIFEKIKTPNKKLVHLLFKKENIVDNKYDVDYVNVVMNLVTLQSYKNNKDIIKKYICQSHGKNPEVFDIDYDLIICLSPKSLYFASLLYNQTPIIYVKAGLGFSYNIPKILEYCKQNNISDFDSTVLSDFMCKFTIAVEDASVSNNENIKFYSTSKLVTTVISKAIMHNLYKKVNENQVSELPFIHIGKSILQTVTSSDNSKMYDIIFVTNDHNKLVKNSEFVIDIFNKLDKHKKIVVGKNSSKFINCPNTEVIDFIDNKDLLKIFSKTKILILPSLYEASPNVIIEAINNNCIPIMSKNSGYSEYVNSPFVVDNFDTMSWIKKINYQLETKFDKKDFSEMMKLMDISYDELTSTINKLTNNKY